MRAAAALLLLAAAPASAELGRLKSPMLAADAARAALTPAAQKAVAGRTALPSVDCIDLRRSYATRIVDNRTILWEQSPRRLFLNMPPRGCRTLAAYRTIVTRSGDSRLCVGDMARVLGQQGNIVGQCRLGRFVPYVK
ncbi:hypothetical protein [Sphingomonas jatrophae]|uniref:Uncharacterized protein n=1 Tax=Sphingomonas jatrophae TaxID=1166337 RepID=A0A1I6LN50_9SPHN|nr:hypothetical protein [Sphingomonas jatrophae]SFS04853.1 hypothetical protein SAMN05192580_3005 [Sphingomonas jatrophae]